MNKEESLVEVRLRYNQEWDSEGDIPYADSIYKMIDTVIEYQLDNMADMNLEDFYRYHMRRHYEDKRNAIEFNDAWVEMQSQNLTTPNITDIIRGNTAKEKEE